VNHGIEAAELIDLRGKRNGRRDTRQIAFSASSARAALRACKTTSCPASTSRRAAIFPSPSAEPVIKTRDITESPLSHLNMPDA
jgi:hypothetical protein